MRALFVTVGATASFRPLLMEILTPIFLTTLAKSKFTNVIVQCGPDYDAFIAALPADAKAAYGLEFEVLDFAEDIAGCMGLTRAGMNADGRQREDGLIITHAGSGSIIEALIHARRLIAVPNTSLMDNHQTEIAREIAKHGYLIYGTIGALSTAVEEAAEKEWLGVWPAPSDDRHTGCEGLWGFVSDMTS